jgi:circadian clock protein KaiC
VNETKRADPQPLAKIATGIEGFDALSGGGLPRHRTTLVMGGPGSGKTVFSLQALVNAARQRAESGIFVAFEERSREVMANAATFDWGLPVLAENQIYILDAHLSPTVVQSGLTETQSDSFSPSGLRTMRAEVRANGLRSRIPGRSMKPETFFQ